MGETEKNAIDQKMEKSSFLLWGKLQKRPLVKKWEKVNGPKLVDISVGHGEIWGVDINNDVYKTMVTNKHTQTPWLWEKLEQKLTQVKYLKFN